MISEKSNIVPSEFIIVGGTGNLSKNKILPALFWRFIDKQIDENSNIILCDKEIKSKDHFFSALKSKCDEAIKKIFDNEIVYNKAFFISHLIQILQFGSIILILISLGVTENYFNFIYIFLISSVLSIFSFGGIGIREYVFFTLASNTAVSPDIATSVGLIFTFSALISSVPGLFFLIKIKSKKKLST